MSQELKDIVEQVKSRFKDFKSSIELANFKDFLLFTLNAPTKVVIGPSFNFGKQDSVTIAYDPFRKVYYTQMQTNLLETGKITVYFSSEPLNDEYILKKEDKFFEDIFTKNEKDTALSGLEKFLFIKKSPGSIEDESNIKTADIIIDEYYNDLECFVHSSGSPIFFILEGNGPGDADLLFSFNILPSLGLSGKVSYSINCYLDKEQKTRDVKYLKQDEKLEITLMKELKDVGHSELFSSTFVLLLKIKSFNIL